MLVFPSALLAVADDPTSPASERAAMHVLDGFDVTLFASEIDGVVKPIQMRFDERGRLWVACSPTYPQIEPGQKPADKIIVLEDTDGDGKADKTTVFADGLLMPTGIEIAEGNSCYVASGTELLKLTDTDGDLKADKREVIFSGFGTGDGHQMLNSFLWGPGGELWMSQGAHTFSNVETPWGIERLYSAGVWRFHPKTQKLEPFLDSRRGHSTNNWAGPANPWGFAFDEWNQLFCNDAAGNRGLSWIVPGLIRSDRDVPIPTLWKIPKGCGIDIIGTKAMPPEMQGRLILGHYFTASVRQFQIGDSESGFALKELAPLITCDQNAFRIIDVKVGPDGAIYLCDWYNPVIGHYQASYRDPNRDKTHGRIWRITAKGMKPTRPPKLAEMKTPELLDQLRTTDRWTLYQAKRLLFTRDSNEVVAAADQWRKSLAGDDAQNDLLLMRLLGVYEAHEAVRDALLEELVTSKRFEARAYAARVIGQWHDRLRNVDHMLERLVQDEHPRVRVEAIVASTFLPDAHGIEIAAMAADRPVDQWIEHAMLRAVDATKDRWQPAFLRGELTFAGKINRLSWVLRCAASPELVGPVRKMLDDPKLAAKDRAELGVLLANIGTPVDLRLLLDRFGNDPEILTELAMAARVRKMIPPGDLAAPLAKLLSEAVPEVRAAAARLAGAWKLKALENPLAELVDKRDLSCRVAAIEAMGEMGVFTYMGDAMPLIMGDHPAAVQIAAVGALASDPDRTLAANAALWLLARFTDPRDIAAVMAPLLARKGGSEALADSIKNFTKFPPKAAERVRDMMHSRGRDDRALIEVLNQVMGVTPDTPPYNEAFVRDLVAETQKTGDAARGKTLYENKLVSCAACHAINGKGGNLGPDISGIGRGLTPDFIVESVLWPRRQVKEGFLSISVSTKTGDEYSGYAVSEDATELKLRDDATNTVQRIAKSAIAKRTNAGTIMPDGLTAGLSRQELCDLMAYLINLGK
jgi:putative heme-binding domain-containing protein